MLKFIERIWIKFLGNTKGYDCNLCDWDVVSLAEHWNTGKPLTQAEKYAKAFLDDVGEVIERWHPTEKWKKPYGSVLNETRKLH